MMLQDFIDQFVGYLGHGRQSYFNSFTS